MSDDENKEREDEFSTEVNVVLEEEEGLKEEKNDTNRLPNIIVNKEKVSEKYKSEKSFEFLFGNLFFSFLLFLFRQFSVAFLKR